MSNNSFGLLGVGDELLSGKVTESNLKYWIAELAKLGRRVTLSVTAPDDPSLLVDTIRFMLVRCDVLLLSGGIGPTHDDKTFACLAEAFGRPLRRDPSLAAAIVSCYGDRVNEALLTMADVPEGTESLYADELMVPLFRLGQVYVFPGAPVLMQRAFACLARQISRHDLFVHVFYTAHEEGEIAALLQSVEDRFPGVAVGSYPRYDEGADYRVMVTVEARSRALLERSLKMFDDEAFRAKLLREERRRVEGPNEDLARGSERDHSEGVKA